MTLDKTKRRILPPRRKYIPPPKCKMRSKIVSAARKPMTVRQPIQHVVAAVVLLAGGLDHLRRGSHLTRAILEIVAAAALIGARDLRTRAPPRLAGTWRRLDDVTREMMQRHARRDDQRQHGATCAAGARGGRTPAGVSPVSDGTPRIVRVDMGGERRAHRSVVTTRDRER